MKITIDNYEAFILDKAEGNLSAENQRLLDEFLVSHPEFKDREAEYDDSIRVFPDLNIVFEDKEALKQKNPVIIHWKSYIAMAVSAAAILVWGIFIFDANNENTAIKPANEKTSTVTASFIPVKAEQTAIKQQSAATKKQPITTKKQPAAISEKSLAREPENEEVKEKEVVVMVDNLVAYQVNNLVEYVEEVDNLVVYEVDNLIEYQQPKHESFFEKKRQELNAIIMKGNKIYEFFYAKVTDKKQIFFNI